MAAHESLYGMVLHALLIPYRGDIGDAFWLMGPYKDTTEPLLKVLNARIA